MGKKELKKISKNSLFLYIFFIFVIEYIFFDMYGLYDRDGVLRCVNSNREACLDYVELFDLHSSHCCLMNSISSFEKENNINLDLNQVENNN
jgi:hypothetical protein